MGMLRLRIVHSVLRHIPKEKGLILCNAWFGQKYIDNTKFVYEYLLQNSNYKVFWLTKNRDIYSLLKQQRKPVVMYNSLQGIIKQIRAQVVFSTVQFSDFNQWLLTNTIYIDLGHGHPIKDPGKAIMMEPVLSLQELYINNLHYYGIMASDFARDRYHDVVAVDQSHLLLSDFARNDVFIDETLRIGKNKIVTRIKGDKKAIVYMPTHRSSGKRKMCMNKILPMENIQTFCESNNYVFIIKKHFYHRAEIEDLEKYPNIFDITGEEDIDPQVLLWQADVLISDYSACYIDYLLLNRPLMFYQYDSIEFQETERSFYIPFELLDFAPIAKCKKDFLDKLSVACNEDDIFRDKRLAFTPTYFKNMTQSGGRDEVKRILDNLIKKYS